MIMDFKCHPWTKADLIQLKQFLMIIMKKKKLTKRIQNEEQEKMKFLDFLTSSNSCWHSLFRSAYGNIIT